MKKITLTENEMKAVKVCLNYNNRDAQLNDNYSNGGVEEFKLELGWNDQQIGGLISSMAEKGIGYMDNKYANAIFWLTEDGVNAYFDQLENDLLLKKLYDNLDPALGATCDCWPNQPCPEHIETIKDYEKQGA